MSRHSRSADETADMELGFAEYLHSTLARIRIAFIQSQ